MKKLLFLFLFCFVCIISSCSNIRNRELFAITDDYVENLNLYKGNGGILGMIGEEKKTEDGSITVCAVGRLIVVKLEYVAKEGEYERLKEDLEDRYSNDSRVNKVYINQGGTVVIDCRN